jgi:hypothetical protein
MHVLACTLKCALETFMVLLVAKAVLCVLVVLPESALRQCCAGLQACDCKYAGIH